MKISHCLPIIKNKKAEVLAVIQENKKDYQYFEVWLDYLEDLEESFITRLNESLGNQVIFLFRRRNLEEIHMPLTKRLEILSLLHKKKALVDLDTLTQEEELSYIRKQKLKVRVITSYHNYKKTPDESTLRTILTKMHFYNPILFKIATFCQIREDALQLLQLLLRLKKENKRVVVLGMGAHGIITRIFGALWGNEMLFAPGEVDEASAPGQMTKTQLEKIFVSF